VPLTASRGIIGYGQRRIPSAESQNAKTFGFGRKRAAGKVRLTELGRAAVDPAQEAWARNRVIPARTALQCDL